METSPDSTSPPTEESKNCANKTNKYLLVLHITPPVEGNGQAPVHFLSVREVKNYLQDNGLTVPDFLEGVFEVLGGYKDHQVAIFKYDFVVGCRKTSSEQHNALPLPILDHNDLAYFTQQPIELRPGTNFWGV